VETSKIVLLTLFGLVFLPRAVWARFAEGHQVVAIIAADDLTPSARSHIAQILGVSADTGSVEKAMATASIRPDTEFREEDRTTRPWHCIDICLQDTKQDVTSRYPQQNCVTAKIDDYARCATRAARNARTGSPGRIRTSDPTVNSR